MDPLSIASGTIGLVSRAIHLRDVLAPLQDQDSKFEVVTEIGIYTKILEEVGRIALSETSTLPESATMALQLCNLHLSKIEEEVKKSARASRTFKTLSVTKVLEPPLKRYRRSVKILRAIVME
jgi:predicted membrane protein